MRLRSLLTTRAVAACTWLVCACLMGGAPLAAAEGLNVVTSSPILADWVHQVGGERVRVTSLISSAVDPHHWEPDPQALKAVGDANLVVVLGSGCEPWSTGLIEAAGYRGPVIELISSVSNPLLNHHGELDPHPWHDVRSAVLMVTAMCDGLIHSDPDGEAHYRRMLALFQAQARVTDAWIRREIATLPESRRVLITPHDGLAYFARAYGLEALHVIGHDDHDEADPHQVTHILDLIQARSLPALFIDGGPHDRLMTTLAAEALVQISGPLMIDGLATNQTYFAMMAANTATIMTALSDSPSHR